MIENIVEKYLNLMLVEESGEIPIHTNKGYLPAMSLSLSVPVKFLQEYQENTGYSYLLHNGTVFMKKTDLFHKIIDAPSKQLIIKLEDVISNLEQAGYKVTSKKIKSDRVRFIFTEILPYYLK